MPRVSVIVAAYQAADTIEETLRSVVAQTYDDWEVIVGDDCSTDATPQLAAAFGERVRVVRSSANTGTPAATRMMAVAHSDAELIAFLDGDDLWRPGYLATMVGAYDRERVGEPVGAICCDAELLLPDGRLAGHTYMDLVGRPAGAIGLDELLRRNPVYTSALLARAVFDAAGGLTSELRGTDDYDLWIRIAESGRPIVYVDRPLARYRVRESSMSGDQLAMAGASGEVYRRALRRGRLTGPQRRLARRSIHLQDAAARIADLSAQRRASGRLPVGGALRALPLLALVAGENARRAPAGLRWLARGRRHYGL
jgi:glycosyltransferase involved in cell wall biosynthesis